MKDLNLDMMDMANNKYDIDRLKKKSINKEKKQIYGELYRGKRIDKRHIRRTGILVATVLALITSNRIANKMEVLDTYDNVLNKKVEKEMDYTESIEFLDSHQPSKKEIYDNYVKTINDLDSEEYTAFGDRKDGTHNETLPLDLNNLVNLSDKQKDAIDELVDSEVEEYKRGK